jgi:hypothetical protein
MVRERRLPKSGIVLQGKYQGSPSIYITETDSSVDTYLCLALVQGHLQSKQTTVFAIRDVHNGLRFVCVECTFT